MSSNPYQPPDVDEEDLKQYFPIRPSDVLNAMAALAIFTLFLSRWGIDVKLTLVLQAIILVLLANILILFVEGK